MAAISLGVLLVALQFPMHGVDFLPHFSMLVDPAAHRLLDRLTLTVLGTVPSHLAMLSWLLGTFLQAVAVTMLRFLLSTQ